MKNVLMKIKDFFVKYYSVIFVVMMLLACIIKQIYFVAMSDNNYHFAFKFFYGLSHVGWYIIPLTITYIALFSFGLLFNNIGRYLWVSVIYIAATVFVFADLAYTRFFQGPSSLFWRIMPHNANNNVTMSIWVHYSPKDVLFFIDLIVFIFMFIWGIIYKLFDYRKVKLVSKLGTILGSIFMICFISIIASNKTVNSLNATKKASAYGNLIYHMIDIAQLPNYNANVKMSNSEKISYEKYETALKADSDASLDTLNYSNILADSNLIVLQLEAIESFVIGNTIETSDGVKHEITPNINKLLNHCLQLNLEEQVHLGNSSDCDLMFMTGQYPVSSVITFNQYEKSDYVSLADVFNSKGYKTSYLNGAYGSTWNYTGVMSSTLGFNEAHYGNEVPADWVDDIYGLRNVCGYISDNCLLRYEEEILNKYSDTDKFYNHIVLCSSHLPYHCPDIINEGFLNDNKLKSKLGGYLYSYISLAHYVDECIGRFINSIEGKGLLDNTSIVIMGDHGGIHKYMSNRTKAKTEGKKKYKWMTSGASYSVPVVIYNKNINGYNVIGNNGSDYNYNDKYKPTTYQKKIGGQIDILPTLSYMYGISDDFKYTNNSKTLSTLMGRNMLKTSLNYSIKSTGYITGSIPSDYSVLKKGKYLSNQLIKSRYFGKKDA